MDYEDYNKCRKEYEKCMNPPKTMVDKIKEYMKPRESPVYQCYKVYEKCMKQNLKDNEKKINE